MIFSPLQSWLASPLGLADLELPPETAQGNLPFDTVKDSTDEIAVQAETLKEPEIPDDQPTV